MLRYRIKKNTNTRRPWKMKLENKIKVQRNEAGWLTELQKFENKIQENINDHRFL